MSAFSPTSVALTGSSGFIGSHLLSELLREEVGNIKLLLRPGSESPAGVSVVTGDLADLPALEHLCCGSECVFHCAGYAHAVNVGTCDFEEMHWRVNFEGTRNLAETAGRAGVKCFVHLSSVKAMAEPGDVCVDESWAGEPGSPYGKAKRAAEDAVLAAGTRYGMHVVNLRLAMVYGRGGRGNLERMAHGIRAGWFPPLPETGNKRSLVHIDDVVAAIRMAAKRPEANGRTYIVADAQAYSGREIYDVIRTILGQGAVSPAPTISWSIPAGLLRAGGVVGDVIGTLLHRPLPLSSEVVDRLLGSACYSPARIHQELGWRARVGLVEGLQEMLGNETL